MTDYSMYSLNKDIFFSGAERKYEILIDGFRYIMKFQKKSEIGLIFNHVSEYIGSHVFELLDIPVQETYLGMYEGKNIVLMKNFCDIGESLVHFNDIGESTLEQDKELYQYSYDDIQEILRDNSKSTNVTKTIERFWNMFIVDALNGNFDRHGGNWGFIKRNGKYRIAPVYDNGSSMYPRINTDERIRSVLSSEEEINERICKFPTSQVKLHGKKSSYFEVISSLQFEECNKALKQIVERFDLDKINNMIDEIEGISDIRREFYKTMYNQRFEKILLYSYNKLRKEE